MSGRGCNPEPTPIHRLPVRGTPFWNKCSTGIFGLVIAVAAAAADLLSMSEMALNVSTVLHLKKQQTWWGSDVIAAYAASSTVPDMWQRW